MNSSEVGSTRHKRHTGRTLTTECRAGREIIAAMVENRAAEVGIAWIDMHTMTLRITQLADAPSFSKTLAQVCIFGFTEICFPATAVKGDMVATMQRHAPDSTSLTAINRKFFNEVSGLTIIQEVTANSALPRLGYLALAAAAAVVQYVQFSHKVSICPRTMRVDCRSPEQYVELDRQTMHALEVLDTKEPDEHSVSMLKVFDCCSTPMGRRMLRTSFLQPLRDLGTITHRQDSVEYLMHAHDIAENIASTLRQLPTHDLDRSFTFLSVTPESRSLASIQGTIDALLHIRDVLRITTQLGEKLFALDAPPLLKEIIVILGSERFLELLEVLDSVLGDSPTEAAAQHGTSSLLRWCFAVKGGVNSVLDFARAQYSASIDAIYEHCEKCRLQTGISGMKVAHPSHSRDALLEFNAKTVLPSEFIACGTASSKKLATTQTLQRLSRISRNAMVELIRCEDAILCEVVEELRRTIDHLHTLSDSIALLDLLNTYRAVSSKFNLVRPSFTDAECLQLNEFRQPSRLDGFDFLPMSLILQGSTIVTGQNGSGKSTILRATAQIVLMAHTGSFVPCALARVSLIDRLVVRSTPDDAQDVTGSTFGEEMRQLAILLRTASPRSLVLIDEFGRGTSNLEASALGWSLIEWLSDVRCKTLFTTHLQALRALTQFAPNVFNYHCSFSLVQAVAAVGERTIIRFSRRLNPGATPLNHYGMMAAESVKISSTILERCRMKCLYIESDFHLIEVAGSPRREPDAKRTLLQLRTFL